MEEAAVIDAITEATIPLLEGENEVAGFQVRPSPIGKGYYDLILSGRAHTFRPKQIEWTAREGSWRVLVEGALKKLRRRELDPEPVYHLVDVYGQLQDCLSAIVRGAVGEKGFQEILTREAAGLDSLDDATRLKIINERLAAWITVSLRSKTEAASPPKPKAKPKRKAVEPPAAQEEPEPARRRRRPRQLASEMELSTIDGGN